jgi:hypothetical protein
MIPANHRLSILPSGLVVPVVARTIPITESADLIVDAANQGSTCRSS